MLVELVAANPPTPHRTGKKRPPEPDSSAGLRGVAQWKVQLPVVISVLISDVANKKGTTITTAQTPGFGLWPLARSPGATAAVGLCVVVQGCTPLCVQSGGTGCWLIWPYITQHLRRVAGPEGDRASEAPRPTRRRGRAARRRAGPRAARRACARVGKRRAARDRSIHATTAAAAGSSTRRRTRAASTDDQTSTARERRSRRYHALMRGGRGDEDDAIGHMCSQKQLYNNCIALLNDCITIAPQLYNDCTPVIATVSWAPRVAARPTILGAEASAAPATTNSTRLESELAARHGEVPASVGRARRRVVGRRRRRGRHARLRHDAPRPRRRRRPRLLRSRRAVVPRRCRPPPPRVRLSPVARPHTRVGGRVHVSPRGVIERAAGRPRPHPRAVKHLAIPDRRRACYYNVHRHITGPLVHCDISVRVTRRDPRPASTPSTPRPSAVARQRCGPRSLSLPPTIAPSNSPRYRGARCLRRETPLAWVMSWCRRVNGSE